MEDAATYPQGGILLARRNEGSEKTMTDTKSSADRLRDRGIGDLAGMMLNVKVLSGEE